MNAKKVISFVVPQTIAEGKTALGQKYEINYENGLKVLNSANTNYSFGSLHQIMQKGLDEVFKRNKPKEILMLGLGAGSALSVLKNKCNWEYSVTVVEIDNELIEIARQHFELDSYRNLTLLNGDALNEINRLQKNFFDLIIDDIFWDDTIPAFCFDTAYLNANKELLKAGGVYMRNTMKSESFNFKDYEKTLTEIFTGYYAQKHPVYGNKIYYCLK